MSTQVGRSATSTGTIRRADDAPEATPARRYASFVVRGLRPGATGALVVAHDQSGEHVRTDSLFEAIGWIQSQATTHSGQTKSPGGGGPGGERQARVLLSDANSLAAQASH